MSPKPLSSFSRCRARLWAELRRCADFLRGNVVRLRRRCVYPACRACRAGVGHPTWYLSRKVAGRTRLTYLPPKNLAAARRGVRQYARVRKLLGGARHTHARRYRDSTRGCGNCWSASRNCTRSA